MNNIDTVGLSYSEIVSLIVSRTSKIKKKVIDSDSIMYLGLCSVANECYKDFLQLRANLGEKYKEQARELETLILKEKFPLPENTFQKFVSRLMLYFKFEIWTNPFLRKFKEEETPKQKEAREYNETYHKILLKSKLQANRKRLGIMLRKCLAGDPMKQNEILDYVFRESNKLTEYERRIEESEVPKSLKQYEGPNIIGGGVEGFRK
jgi:hypothetical protein